MRFNCCLVPWLFALLSAVPLAARPDIRLVVIIVVDQMRFDMLENYQGAFGHGGFRRLQSEGLTFRHHFIPYSNTETGVGHASIGTGLLPRTHGIVKNLWKDSATGQYVFCTAGEAGDSVLGTAGKQKAGFGQWRGPASLGERIKQADPAARVFSISSKERSSLFLAGRKADGAYWFGDRGEATTSGCIRSTLPGWVEGWNREHPLPAAESIFTNLRPDAPANPYPRPGGPAAPAFEEKIPATGFLESPLAIARQLDFIRQLARAEGLGTDAHPDLLAWSISQTDFSGHLYGLESPQTMDAYGRADSAISLLLTFLDSLAGPDRYALFLTSDHGLRKTVTLEVAAGIPGSFLLTEEELIAAFQARMFGNAPPPADAKGLVKIMDNDIFIDRARAEKLGLPADSVKAALSASLRNHPGIREVYDPSLPPRTAFDSAWLLSRFPGRSGDLGLDIGFSSAFKVRPGMHGYFGEDCRHLPLLAMLPGRKPAVIDRPTSIIDLAPTICRLLNLDAKGMEGRPLSEVIGP